MMTPPVWSAGARSLPGLAGWAVWLGDRPENRRRGIAFSFVCSVIVWSRVAVHEVTRIPDAGVLSLVRPELESLDASSHIWLMCAAAFCEQGAALLATTGRATWMEHAAKVPGWVVACL